MDDRFLDDLNGREPGKTQNAEAEPTKAQLIDAAGPSAEPAEAQVIDEAGPSAEPAEAQAISEAVSAETRVTGEADLPAVPAEEWETADEDLPVEPADVREDAGSLPSAPADPVRRPSIFAANALYLLGGAGLILLQLVMEPLAALLITLFPQLSAESLVLIVNSCYYIPCLLLPAALYAGSRGVWESMRLSRAPKWRHIWRALLAAAISVPLGTALSLVWYMILQACGLTVIEESFLVPSTLPGLMLMLVCLGVLPGVCEELAFRGMALGAWERRGSVRAILISSLMFASLHGSVAGFPVHFLLGCVIGVMAVGSGSVYTGMIFHGVYNSILLLIAYWAQGAAEMAEPEMAAAELTAFTTAGTVMLVMVVIALGAAMFFTLRGLWPQKADTDYGADDWERPEEREQPVGDVSLVPRTRGQMDWQELVVMISAVITVLFMYGKDLLTMIGGGA